MKCLFIACLLLMFLVTSAREALARKHGGPEMPDWARPIRIPTNVEITHSEPPFAIAKETSSWRVPFILSRDVPAGEALHIQISGGRNNKGEFNPLQVDDPSAKGYVTATLGDGGSLALRRAAGLNVLSFDVPDGGLAKGQKIIVTLGDQAGGGEGATVSNSRLLNKFIVLYADEKTKDGSPAKVGKGTWSEGNNHLIVGACTLHILGGPIDHLRAYMSSNTQPGKPCEILVRPEDAFGNLASERLEDVELFLGEQALPAKVRKVKDSTCLRVRTTLPTQGIHRLRVVDAKRNLEAITNPARCYPSGDSPVYWGMIHGHTEMSDGTGTLEQYYHQLRNEVALDFAANGDHDHGYETPDAYWKKTCEAVRKWHDPSDFVTFLGYEWAKWRKNGDADRNVYYLEDDRLLYRSDNGEYPNPPALFTALTANDEKALVIPHHTGHGGNFCDWKDHDPRFERLVEIFQIRGSYECSKEDGNPLPEIKDTPPPMPIGYVREALARGWRVGFTAGGDDHVGQWGTEFLINGVYKQGLMSVQTPELTREALFDAMYQRRVVATTGGRILLDYTLNEKPMGSELSVSEMEQLKNKRLLRFEFHGTAPLDRIDIIRNNKVVHTLEGNGRLDVCEAWEDTEDIEKTWLPPAKFCENPFTFYYIRVIQIDKDVAWASPIWIDP